MFHSSRNIQRCSKSQLDSQTRIRITRARKHRIIQRNLHLPTTRQRQGKRGRENIAVGGASLPQSGPVRLHGVPLHRWLSQWLPGHSHASILLIACPTKVYHYYRVLPAPSPPPPPPAFVVPYLAHWIRSFSCTISLPRARSPLSHQLSLSITRACLFLLPLCIHSHSPFTPRLIPVSDTGISHVLEHGVLNRLKAGVAYGEVETLALFELLRDCFD